MRKTLIEASPKLCSLKVVELEFKSRTFYKDFFFFFKGLFGQLNSSATVGRILD